MALTVMGAPRSGARARALAFVLAALVVALVPHRWSVALPGDATPIVSITAPIKDHVFEPGESILVEGTATDDQGVLGVKLEYWLLNTMALYAIADCAGCGTTNASWSHAPDLDPGYYVVKARSVDLAGNHSQYASRNFVAGLEQLPPPPEVEEPVLPDPSESPPPIEPPIIETPDEGDLLPGAEQPVPIGGTAEPGQTITVGDEEQGDLASVETGEDGRWRATLRLPSGTYAVTARATDEDGNVGPLTDVVTFEVDSKRPIAVLSQEDRVFLPTQQVVVDGTVSDDRGVGFVWVEYWQLGKLVLHEQATCACPATQAAWSHRPALPGPGQYNVKVLAFDVAGNPSHVKTMTVTTSGI